MHLRASAFSGFLLNADQKSYFTAGLALRQRKYQTFVPFVSIR